MTADKKEIPPLEELAKGSLKEVQDFLPSLSLPEVLIIGARPFDIHPRRNQDLHVFRSIAKEKLSELEKERDQIFGDIMSNLYPNEYLEGHNVRNYLEKYRLITNNFSESHLLNIVVGINPSILREMEEYATAIKEFSGGHYKGMRRKTKNEITNLQNTPVKLRYFINKKIGNDPYLICTKTKVDERIAKKIPYHMIKDYRRHSPEGVKRHNEMKKYFNLNRGVNKDNVGMQIVIYALGNEGRDKILKIKQYMAKSDDIEIVLNREQRDFEDHAADPGRDYSSIHIDAAWTPAGEMPAQFNQHRDTIEIQLQTISDCIRSNFGPRSYWRYTNGQYKGIVLPTLKRAGHLDILPFTPIEMEWKQMVENRIMAQLTYGGK